LWFEVDRHREGAKGMLASLLGVGQLKRELTIPLNATPNEAGQQVLEYLESKARCGILRWKCSNT